MAMKKMLGMMIAAVLMSAAGAMGGTPVPTITNLGLLPEEGGGGGSVPQAISDDGSTITGDGIGFSNTDEAYRWTDALGIQSLDVEDDEITGSRGTCISADGSVIAGWYTSNSFFWTESTGWTIVTNNTGSGYVRVQAMSSDGQTLAGMFSPAGLPIQAGRWTAVDGWTVLGGAKPATDIDSDGTMNSVWDASADANVLVGTYSDQDLPSAQRTQGCRWSSVDGITVFPMLNGTDATSSVYGVSADGNTAVGVTRNTVAFRWTVDGGTTSLGFLPGFNRSSASALSANGLVAVGFSTQSGQNSAAFVWDETNGMRNLRQLLIDAGTSDINNWSELIEGHDVSADGRYITGRGRYFGQIQGFIIDMGVGVTPPGCAADFNGDDVRDVSDLFAYINAWLAKTTDADFNADTTVDVSDLFAYINAWLAGC